jgi:hypothetical protein
MGKEIGASYLLVGPISRALRSLQYRPFPIRQTVEIRGGFDILSGNTVLFSSFIQPSQMSTSDVESGTDLLTSSNSPFLTKKDTLNASLAGTECANSLLSSIPPMCVKIPRSRLSSTTVESADAYDHSMERY